MWAGVQPEEGQVNQTYVNILKSIVQDYGKLGIYTILDMHQDVLWQAGSNQDQGYWGVPKWIKDKLDQPSRLFPWPFTGTPWAWECGYLTEEVSRGFGQFFKNVNGVADDFANFWQIMAQQFKNEDFVLGYELINEPFAGDIYEAFSVALPGLAGSRNLAPLYEKAAAKIREIDTETLIFYEPVTWGYFSPLQDNELANTLLTDILDNLGFFSISEAVTQVCGPMDPNVTFALPPKESYQDESVSVLGPGFSQVPGGPDYRNRSVLSWHYYCELYDSSHGNDTVESILVQFFCDILFGPDVFNTVDLRTQELGGASMLTEFGLCYPNISDPASHNTVECSRVMDLADSHFQSWTYWDTDSFWNTEGRPKNDLVAVFSRPYPRATAGTPTKLSYDLLSKEFVYSFNLDESIQEPTEIYIPPLIYPEHQVDIDLSSSLSWNLSPDDPNVIFVTPRKSQTIQVENPVTVSLKPVVRLFASSSSLDGK